MQPIPSNLTLYVYGFPVFLLFAWRAYSNYRRLHNPLSAYFAWSGLSAGLAFFFWGVPFAFSSQEIVWQVTSMIGDFWLYVMLVIQASLVYYLTLRNKISQKLVLTPVIALALAGFASHVYGYLHYGVSITDDKFEYTLPLFASIAQSILIVNVLLVGILLLSKLKEQSTGRSRGSLIGVAFLYLLSGIAGLINVVFSGTSNDSPLIIGGYIFGFVVFVGALVVIRFRKSSK